MDSLTDSQVLDQIKRFANPPSWYVYKPFVHLAGLIVCVSMAVWVSLPWKPVWIIGADTQFIGLYALLHGASHFHLSKNHKVNDALGTFLAAVLGTSFHAYRVCHLRHHVLLRQKDDPQDVVNTFPKSRVVTAALITIASVIGAAIFIWIRVPFLGAMHGSARRVAAELLLPVTLYAVVIWLLITTLPASGLIVLAATLASAIVWGSLIDIVYHQGLPTTGETECSRSLDCDRFGFWVLNGENRHAEHHAYPNVPLPNWRYLTPTVKPIMQQKGAVYERGYVTALMKCLFVCPMFLPPVSRETGQQP